MALIKSGFWLTVAFVAIGPQTSIHDLAFDTASTGVELGRSAAQHQVASLSCEASECALQQIILSSGIDLAADAAMSQLHKGRGPTLTAPIPRAPLDRD